MSEKELAQLTDEELLHKAKKLKSDSFMSALVIGIMIGVVIYSVAANTVGLFTLIPLYFAYKLVKNDKNNEPLKKVLKDRNLN